MISCVNEPKLYMEPCVYFLYLSHLLYGICVNIFIMNQYISKTATQRARILLKTIYRAGRLWCQLFLVSFQTFALSALLSYHPPPPSPLPSPQLVLVLYILPRLNSGKLFINFFVYFLNFISSGVGDCYTDSSEAGHVATSQTNSQESYLLSISSAWRVSVLANFPCCSADFSTLVPCSRMSGRIARPGDGHVKCEFTNKYIFNNTIK